MNKYTLSYRFLNGNVHGCVFAKNRPVSLNWSDYKYVFCSTENISSMSCTNNASPETGISIDTDLIFRSRGLHLCNLNIRHLVPKLDELRISMTHNQCPDIFGMCEAFLTHSVSDEQLKLEGFDLI